MLYINISINNVHHKWSGQIHRVAIYDGLSDCCQECNGSILHRPCVAETYFSPAACYANH